MSTIINYFITGTNKGIGFALVKEFSAKKNVKIFATVRDLARSDDLKKLSAERGNIEIVELTPSSIESIEKIPAYLEKAAPEGIDYFIGNAGYAGNMGRVIDKSYDEFIDIYKTNVFANIFLFKALYPSLLKKDTKKVIFISSEAGSLTAFSGLPMGVYGSTKSALNRLTRSLSSDHAEEGFTVIVVHPGAVATEPVLEMAKFFPPEALEGFNILQPEETAKHQVKLYDNLTKKDSGKFFQYDGAEYPW